MDRWVLQKLSGLLFGFFVIIPHFTLPPIPPAEEDGRKTDQFGFGGINGVKMISPSAPIVAFPDFFPKSSISRL